MLKQRVIIPTAKSLPSPWDLGDKIPPRNGEMVTNNNTLLVTSEEKVKLKLLLHSKNLGLIPTPVRAEASR